MARGPEGFLTGSEDPWHSPIPRPPGVQDVSKTGADSRGLVQAEMAARSEPSQLADQARTVVVVLLT
jgi:hypothetical protein